MLGTWTLALVTQGFAPRQVVAPPSDIAEGVVALPEPRSTSTRSRARFEPLRFERAGRTWRADLRMHVEQGTPCTLALLSPSANRWRVLAAPDGQPLQDLDALGVLARSSELAGELFPGSVLVRRELLRARSGPWNVRIEADREGDADQGWAILAGDRTLDAQAWLSTATLVRGSPVAVLVRSGDGREVRVQSAHCTIESANALHRMPMFDDGEHADGLRNDGVFGAWLPHDVLGEVRACATICGTSAREAYFERSVPLAFVVHEPLLELQAEATATLLGDSKCAISVPAQPRDDARRIQVSAEVWGRGESGLVPLCWLSRMEEPRSVDSGWSLELEFDTRWLDVAGAGELAELRNVRVQDPDTSGVLALAERMPVRTQAACANSATTFTGGAAALLANLTTPVATRAPWSGERPIQPGLALIHGYCSTVPPWPTADFREPKYVFLDSSANRSHDQFAQLVASRLDAAQFSSFGIVGHSQGGCAALHLLTYYESGLDHAVGPRRIQSVATPYQGTPLASLGFFTCGTNSNLTTSGAATWLAGIPTWARAEVSYWTTSNSGAACNFLSGLLLTDPEDGTVERTRGQLPGANSMGHVVGWCHTTGMSNTANYLDHGRNVQMDAAAAR
jgi:hypothetical protein